MANVPKISISVIYISPMRTMNLHYLVHFHQVYASDTQVKLRTKLIGAEELFLALLHDSNSKAYFDLDVSEFPISQLRVQISFQH